MIFFPQVFLVKIRLLVVFLVLLLGCVLLVVTFWVFVFCSGVFVLWLGLPLLLLVLCCVLFGLLLRWCFGWCAGVCC